MTSTEDRFWARVDASGGAEACWPWLRARNNSGYGSCSWSGKVRSAHRVAAYLHGLVDTVEQPPRSGHGHVLHECDNRPCCNPSHFKIGTYRQNQLDAYARRRREQPRSTHVNAKLTPEQVREMRSSGDTYASLARRFGVHETAARYVVIGRTYVDVV